MGRGVIFLIHINIYKEYEGEVCRNEIDQLTVKRWPIYPMLRDNCLMFYLDKAVNWYAT